MKSLITKFRTVEQTKTNLVMETYKVPGMNCKNLPGNFIGEVWNEDDFLLFINGVINNTNVKQEFMTSAYSAKVVEKEEGKMIEISFYLTNDYNSYYICPKELKGIFLIWLKELHDFQKNPYTYKIKMLQNGAKIIVLSDFKDNDDYNNKIKKIIAESPNGVIEVKTEEEAEELRKCI